ncbi:MAG: DNA cytosine methyltransferase [Candidatus Anammoxibacter sp.]
MKKKKIKSVRLGEIFAGPGGIALGAIGSKVVTKDTVCSINHVWATDYDPDTCETYRHNICPGNPASVLCGDIRKLNFGKLKRISEIDALAFGFPCNDFSVVGEQKGINGNYGPLYSYGVKALKFFQPKWFLAENVGGLRNANEGMAFNTILQEFYNAGYSVYPHLYKFANYGVPQARQRIIIIGIHKELSVSFKIPSTKPFEKIDVTCRNAIESPPINKNALNNDLTKQSVNVVERLKYIKPGENAFTADLPSNLQLNVRGAKISQIYKRLDPKKPAYTVTGSGGGGTHMYHWKENRALTNRERARLQTFPDTFGFKGSKESVRKQIGMAVPPDGIKVIFESILKCFESVDYEHTEPSFKPLIHENQVEEYNLTLGNGQQLVLFEKEEIFKTSKKSVYANR